MHKETKRCVVIVGAGGHGKVALEAALEAKYPVAYVVDDNPHVSEVLGVRVVVSSDVDWQRNNDFGFLVAVGDNIVRSRLFQQMLGKGGTPITIVHPKAIVSRYAQLGSGTFVCAGAVINPGAVIGDNCIINTACSVDHDCRIGKHAHICPGVHLAGDVAVGEGTMLGTGTSVIPGMKIGAWSKIGAGTTVVRDIPDWSIAFGVPAKVQRKILPLSESNK